MTKNKVTVDIKLQDMQRPFQFSKVQKIRYITKRCKEVDIFTCTLSTRKVEFNKDSRTYEFKGN